MGNFIATLFCRLFNMQSSSATTKLAASEDKEEEEISEPEMPQLPDTVLRMVFKKLKFSDIKSCRLVCKQWHRFALDNVIFMLAADHDWPIEPGDNAILTSERSNSPALDQDRYRFKLVPFSAATEPTTIREACESKDRSKMVAKPATQLRLEQLTDFLIDSFKQRIIYVQLFIAKRREMPPVLRAFADSLPAAQLICVKHDHNETARLPGIWAAFERERGRQSDRSALKLRKMRVNPQYFERASPETIQLLSSEAGNVCEIDSNWPVIEQLLQHFEANNDGESLLFDECQKLVCGGTLSRGSTLFLQISSHFRNVQELCIAGRSNADLDFENLERLAGLKTLELSHRRGFRVPSLFLPSSLSSLTLRCLLPDNPKFFVSSCLKFLRFDAVAKNMRKLAAHASDAGNNLANLKSMYLVRADMEAVRTFLPIILRTASKVEHLVLYPLPPRLPASDEIETLYAIWMDIASVSMRLTEFVCGQFIVPNAIDGNGLLERIMQRMVRAKFRPPFVVIEFIDNTANDLSTALLARGGSIVIVERGTRTEAAFTRRGDETRQTLQIRVFSLGAA